MKQVWGAIVLVISLAGAGFGALSGRGLLKPVPSAVQAQTQLQVVFGPEKWVPFSAIATNVHGSGPTVVGKFYRASDGSIRSESGPSFADVNIIGIENVSERTFYWWHASRGWESHPMDLPPSGWQPLRKRSFNVLNDLTTDRIEGFDVMGTTDRHHITTYEAPQLNFFRLRTVVPCPDSMQTGCGIWLSEISIAEQPSEYFRPPLGERIVQRSEPGGIVKHERQ